MKKFILAYLHCVFSDHKWYRRKKGGNWYKLCDHRFAGGIEGGAFTSWTQRVEDLQNAEILEKEEWPAAK